MKRRGRKDVGVGRRSGTRCSRPLAGTWGVREVSATVLARQQKQCNFIEYKDKKIVYKRYASLYFLACVDDDDNDCEYDDNGDDECY